MRYYIYYPPTKSMRLIDVNENVLIKDILILAKKEFGLNFEDSGPNETSIVLNFNGSDLKSKWSLADVNIPSGSIIRCLCREHKAADLYVYCDFNKQTFKLFDSSITIETTIATIRKKISNGLGLPLSLFCLETCNNNQRLFDEMKLINSDIKIHDYVYLKVWKGYEKFLNACIKGFAESYSHDDLTRHYQAQVALYIAAFYGHMELANSAMQQGARCDQPVGEHPCRQWSSKSTAENLPEMLKCPIHVAIECGHIKIVDLFARNNILCTQIREPITGYLPFRLALFHSVSSKTKEDKHRYRAVYLYLHDKQFNFRVPLNASGDYVSNLLTSTVSHNAVHHSSQNLFYVSLSLYSKIVRWYERAREKVWKKYGGHFYTTPQTKRVYPKQGLLGYKVLIDGYNNKFEVPLENINNKNNVRSSSTHIPYADMDDTEREKLVKMKSFVKQFALDDRKRAKQIAAENLKQSRRPPVLVSSTKTQRKIQNTPINITSSIEISNPSKRMNNADVDVKLCKSMIDIDNPSIPNLASFAYPSAPILTTKIEDNRLTKTAPKIMHSISSSRSLSTNNDDDKTPLFTMTSPTSEESENHTSLTRKIDNVLLSNMNVLQPIRSSADAYALSSSRMSHENEQHKKAKRRELFQEIKQSVEKHEPNEPDIPIKGRAVSGSTYRKIADVDIHIPLPERSTIRNSSPIKSRIDMDIRQSAVKSYERYASATTRSTAVNCLQEASFFKGKSWLKQVEISKEMVKHHVKRRIRRSYNEQITNKPLLLPLRTNNIDQSKSSMKT